MSASLQTARQMMQYAARHDEIEGPSEPRQFEDIGLGIFDPLETERARLAAGIGEAAEAQVDG